MSGRKTGLSRDFAPRMRIAAALMGAAVALLTPATYLTMTVRNQALQAEYLAREVAVQVKAVVRADPDLWKFSVVKFTRVFDSLETERIVGVRVYDEKDALIAVEEFGSPSLLAITGSSGIAYNNASFGRVEVDKRADSTVYESLGLLVAFGLLGAASAYAIYRYPTGIVRRAEASVDETLGMLEREASARASKEAQLETALAEKNTLLMEVHHRVKNNLQVITSLVSLKASRAANGQYRELLDDVHRKIRSMAIVHEQIYSHPSLSLIDMDQYLRSLIGASGIDKAEGEASIEYSIDGSGLQLSIEQAMPIGLIVSELVMNCRKHAFAGRRSGRVAVRLAGDGAGGMTLCVEDDGAGADPAALERAGGGLGYVLVRSLASQLGGRLEIRSEGGLRARVRGIGAREDRA